MLYESNYLMHYRTKGSKNGVRRYQNEDGTLTAEGREHYGVGDPRKKNSVVGGNSTENKKAQFMGLFKKKNNKDPEEAENKAAPQKNANNSSKLGKVLKVGAGVAVATALAYAGSKHIKNKANNLLDKEHNRNVRSIMAQHDLLSRNIRNGGYDANTVNYNLNRQRKITNTNLEAYDRSRDNQRNKNNRSTREAIKYIRSHR